MKCELIGGVSRRHLNTFSNLFVVGCTLHTYQYLLCVIAVVDCTHVHHVVQNIRTCNTLLLLLTVPMDTMLSKTSEHAIPCCYC